MDENDRYEMDENDRYEMDENDRYGMDKNDRCLYGGTNANDWGRGTYRYDTDRGTRLHTALYDRIYTTQLFARLGLPYTLPAARHTREPICLGKESPYQCTGR